MKFKGYYRMGDKRRQCRKQTALALLVCLSLSGSVSLAADPAGPDTGKTYDKVNAWSGDATDGDPITVKDLQGWSQDKVTVGTDATNHVTIENYGGSNGGEATVLGKNIAFTGGFSTGGAITAGNAATDSLSAVTVNVWGQSADGPVELDGKNLSVTGSEGVHATNGSAVNLGTQYMTGDLHIQSLDVSNSSTVNIGNANAGDVTIEEFKVAGFQYDSSGNTRLNTITVSGNNLTIGNTKAAESHAQVTFNARGNVTAENGLVMTGSGLSSSTPYAAVTVNAGGDVKVGKYGQTTNPYERNAALAAVGGHAKIEVTAAGNLEAHGNFEATGDGSIRVKAANISSDRLLHATGKNTSLTLLAEDPDGNKGEIKAQELQVDTDGTATLTGKTITLAPDGRSFHRSLHVTDCDVNMDAEEINLASGILFNGTAELNLKASDKLTIGNAADASYDSSAIRLTYGSYETSAGTGKLYAGGSQADVTVNGSTAVVGSPDEKEIAWFDGKNLVFNASKTPALTDNFSDMYKAVALDFTTSQFQSGNPDTTESSTVNGHILTNGANSFVLYGSKAVTVNGLKGDYENNKNAYSLIDRGNSVIQIGEEDTAQTTVNGEIATGVNTVLYVGGKNILLDNAGHTALYANDSSKSVEIGRTSLDGKTADTVAIKGRLLVNNPARMEVVGKNITIRDGAAPDSGTLGTTVKTREDLSYTETDGNTHDALVIQQAPDDAVVIGEPDSNVSIDGRLVGLNGGYSVQGNTIHIYEGTNKNQNLILTTGGAVNLGSDTTRLLQVDGGIWGMGDSTNKVSLQGQDIVVDPANGMRAVQANAMPVEIGGGATELAKVNGEIWSICNKAPITLDAKQYILSANGSTYAAHSSGAGSVTIGHDGSVGKIDGKLTADAGSSLEAYLKGSSSLLDGSVDDKNLDYGISPDAGVTLHLNDGAVWNLDGDSKVTRLQADYGIVHLNQDTTDQSLYTGTFSGDGAVIFMGHAGNTTQNDHIYVKGAHTGTTALQLHSVNGEWTDGAIGSVLASVGDEQGSFYVPDREDRLFFHRTVLDTHETSKGDTVTDGYNTDWYLKGFEKRPTDDQGNYTDTVRELMGADNVNYHIWRTEQDTLFRRMGDLRKGERGQEGIWARVKGLSIRRNGSFAFEDQYKTYELGYDRLAGHNDAQEHYQGIGFGYTDGKASYFGGRSDTDSYALGLYDTRVRKDGTYLDLALRLHRLTNKLVAHDGISGHADNTGLSFGAEYGYKKDLGQGWFVEPQVQGTLGWLSGASWSMDNGVIVEEQDIRSAVVRAGLRAGYEGDKAQAFLKANWYHEFGGSGQVHLRDDEGELFLNRDYGDTWFEYGLGAAVQISPAAQLYADLERSSGGEFRKDWSWDAGIRWNF